MSTVIIIGGGDEDFVVAEPSIVQNQTGHTVTVTCTDRDTTFTPASVGANGSLSVPAGGYTIT